LGPIETDRVREAEDSVIIPNSTRLVPTKERAHGRWREILPALGIDETYLSGRNCPCPICGGTDRFRFLDRRGKDGDGMWVCNQCTPKPRPAIELAIAFTGKPFREAARAIDDILGDRSVIAQTSIRLPKDDGGKTNKHFLKAWRRGVRVRPGDVVDLYLRRRGVGLDIYPPCLRTSELDYYREDDQSWLPADGERYLGRPDLLVEVIYRIPAMVAAVTNPDGKHIATHRTFLAEDGYGKANVSTPRKVAGKYGRGPTIRLMPTAPLMGIAEGIETALAASRLFRIPVWSVLCAHGIETFEPPAECQHLVVFADHDKNRTSQRAAESLKTRLPIPVEIRMPDQPGTDWNDALLQASR
jgi:putative DNA primase/helicase